jgi:hypothetical protein
MATLATGKYSLTERITFWTEVLSGYGRYYVLLHESIEMKCYIDIDLFDLENI